MDSKLFIGMVVLACLVAEARCGLLDAVLPPKKSTADFDGLDSLLVANVNSTELADNLKYIKDNMDTFEDARVQNAAELVLKVSEMKVDTCGAQVLSVMNELAQTNLDVFGHKRIEQLVSSVGMKNARYRCFLFASMSIVELNQDYILFFKYLRPSSNEEILEEVRKKVEHKQDERFRFSYRDQSSGEFYTAKVAKRFESAIQEYVMKPCKKYLADDRLNLLVDRYTALKLYGDNYSQEIDSKGYTKLAWTKEKCYEFLTMDAAARAKLYQSISGRELELKSIMSLSTTKSLHDIA